MVPRLAVVLLLAGSGAPAFAVPGSGAAPESADTLGTDSLRVTVATGVPLGWTQLLQDREVVTFEPRSLRRTLRHAFLRPEAEIVREGGRQLQRNRDYGIDHARGVLFLLQPIETVRVLEIHYGYMPGPSRRRFDAAEVLSREEAHTRSAAAAESQPHAKGGATMATALASSRGDPTPAAAHPDRSGSGTGVRMPQGLQLIGSKTIGVTFGQNREASLEQSLRVQVSGQLSEDLHVDAVLSDDNLPVLPDGDTEELGDLNRVFVSVQGPVVGGVVGDFELRQEEGEFVRFDRALRGGGAHVTFGGQRLSASAGLAKGELLEISFRGTEGKQGPYELLSARRLGGSVIIPGSERVYMDGQALQRGANHDYVIDYGRGEVRFSSRRRVTADSEIDIEFQVTSQSYRRDTRGARLESRSSDWQLTAFALQEGDQGDRPLGPELTPEETALLASSGDGLAVAPGIHPTEPGSGSYRWGDVDSTYVVYDPESGDLRVEFYEVGFGRGSYEDSLDVATGLRIFQWVGTDQGTYAIGRLLTPPERTRMATGLLRGAPWTGAALVAEASVSDHDGNLLSSRGDVDNQGEAVDIAFDSGRGSLGGLGHAGVSVHLSQLSPRFRSLGTQRRAFYYKEWNAEQDSLLTTEQLAEATLHWASAATAPWLRVHANLGRLDRQATLQTDRRQWDVQVGRERQRGGEFRWQALDTVRPELGPDGGRERRFGRGALRYQLGVFLPEVRYEQDTFTRSALDSLVRPSYRYQDIRYLLGIGRGRTRATLQWGRRDTDALQDAGSDAGARRWLADRRNDSFGIDLLSRPSRSWNAELSWSRRTNEPRSAESTSPATRSDLGRMMLSWRPPQGLAGGEVRYEISDEEARQFETILVLSPDGKGDYDAEGRPVGKDQGEYDRLSRYLGGSIPVRELTASMRLELGRAGSSFHDTTSSWWKRNVSLTQVLSVQEQTRDESKSLYLLQPSAFQNANTVFGSFLARQEWSFLNAQRVHSLRLFLDLENVLDARSGSEAVESQRREARATYEHTRSRQLTLGVDAAAARRQRLGALAARVPGRPSSDSYDVQQQRLAGQVTVRFSSNERLLVELHATRQADAYSGTRQRLLGVNPSLALAPFRNARILAGGSLTRVFEERLAGVLPPYFFDAPGTRLRANLTASYRLGRNLNLNITYAGTRQTDGRTTYDVKAETRAIF